MEAIIRKVKSTLISRFSYVVEEDRVLKAKEALRSQDQKLGSLLYTSHEGLKHKYKVSCPEL